MSHHPPVSRFLIISVNKDWRYYGYYEYIAKISSLTGNSVSGQFRGPNIVEFIKSNETIEFCYPNMNITGLMYGKRIIDWDGEIQFKDYKNDLTANLAFTPAPRFFQKFKEPTDTMRGEIKQQGKLIHKLFGSPIDKLMIDNTV